MCVMEAMRLLRFAAVVLLAAGAWIVLEASSVSAQTTGTDAIKMFDKDGDGSIDLKEAKAAAAAEFDKMDKDHEGTVDNEELGGRVTLLDQQLQEGRFRFGNKGHTHEGSVPRTRRNPVQNCRSRQQWYP